MNIGIPGLGLIGGSMAKAIKRYTEHTVLGFDQDETVMEAALSDGSIDGRLTAEKLGSCQILLPALYPAATVQYVKEMLPFLPEDLLIVDLCGVKAAVMDPIGQLSLPKGAVYIGGHPMAGKEKSGFRYAEANLFQGASMILVPQKQAVKSGDPDYEALYDRALRYAGDFFLSLGFARITRTTKEEHDRIIAYTSQLAHVVSSAYMKSPTALLHSGFSAGSYKDLTRVARLNEEMWTELFLDNRTALLTELDAMIESLCAYRKAIRAGDKEGLKAQLREGRERKEQIDSYEKS